MTWIRGLFFALVFSNLGQAQSNINYFLKPSDSINVLRKKTVYVGESVVFGAAKKLMHLIIPQKLSKKLLKI